MLVAMLLGVKAKLLPSGPVKILINDEKDSEDKDSSKSSNQKTRKLPG